MGPSTFAFFLVLISSTFAFAQVQVPSSPPATDDPIKISTDLVQIDVKISDSKGRAIHDLRRDEVEIFHNGKKQQITAVTSMSGDRRHTTVGQRKGGKLGAVPTAPPLPLSPAQVHRSVALVLDDLNTSATDFSLIKKGLRKFVDERMQPGDLVAILRVSGIVGPLQQFTNDKRVLHAAIDKLQWNPQSAFGVNTFEPIATNGSMPYAVGGKTYDMAPAPSVSLGGWNSRPVNGCPGAYWMLNSLHFIVSSMSELPGKKTAVVMSNGFSRQLVNDFTRGTLETGDTFNPCPLQKIMSQAVDASYRSSVVINTIDVSGVVYTGLTAADSFDLKDLKPSGTAYGSPIDRALRSRQRSSLDNHTGPAYLAQQAGGKFVANTNDVAAGIAEVLDEGGLYRISFEPNAEGFDPKSLPFNSIEVKVNRSGADVRYTKGFLRTGGTDAKKDLGPDDLAKVIASPFIHNQITVALNSLYDRDRAGDMLRIFIHVDAKDLTLTQGEHGKINAGFDLRAVLYGDNGAILNQMAKTIDLAMTADIYERFKQEGLVYNVDLPVKDAGTAQLRVGLMDRSSKKVGSAQQTVMIPQISAVGAALSGIYLENIGPATWLQRSKGKDTSDAESNEGPHKAIAVRKFRRGTILNYLCSVLYKDAPTKRPTLKAQANIYQGGEAVMAGEFHSVASDPQQDLTRIPIVGSLNLGTEMQLGEYLMQIVVTDEATRRTATQVVNFEIVD